MIKVDHVERIEEKERAKIELIENINIEPDRGQNKKPEAEEEVRPQQVDQQVQVQKPKPKPFVQTVTPEYISQLGMSN